jgi:hypothetical protein
MHREYQALHGIEHFHPILLHSILVPSFRPLKRGSLHPEIKTKLSKFFNSSQIEAIDVRSLYFSISQVIFKNNNFDFSSTQSFTHSLTHSLTHNHKKLSFLKIAISNDGFVLIQGPPGS